MINAFISIGLLGCVLTVAILALFGLAVMAGCISFLASVTKHKLQTDGNRRNERDEQISLAKNIHRAICGLLDIVKPLRIFRTNKTPNLGRYLDANRNKRNKENSGDKTPHLLLDKSDGVTNKYTESH